MGGAADTNHSQELQKDQLSRAFTNMEGKLEIWRFSAVSFNNRVCLWAGGRVLTLVVVHGAGRRFPQLQLIVEDDATDHVGSVGAGGPGCPTAAGWKTEAGVINVTSADLCQPATVLLLLVLERVRMLDGCLSRGELKPEIQPPKSLLMSSVL